ncbi:MAG TPA: GAF domain-containing protein, partial [Actinomycetota bacterium]|nr:GAF domain-containing protein [Actinomycetota bacterium]
QGFEPAEPGADFERLSSSIEQVSDVLGDQPLEFYERDLPQIAAAETARRVRADVVVLLLDNGEGLLEVSGGVGLTPAERRMNVDYNRDVMRELFRAGVGLVEDTDRVRGALAGIPGSRAETLVMVPLVHDRLGFGVLVAGRRRSPNGLETAVFTDQEVEALMSFADDAAPSLRTAVLLRHLKRQLKPIE